MVSQYKPIFLNSETGEWIFSLDNPYNYTKTISYTQTVPYNVWTVQHNMNSNHFIIKIFDNKNVEIIPDRVYIIDLNNISITFSSNVTGNTMIHFFG